jgi:hypothetical protein
MDKISWMNKWTSMNEFSHYVWWNQGGPNLIKTPLAHLVEGLVKIKTWSTFI